MITLNTKNVSDIFKDCLLKEIPEVGTEVIYVRGITVDIVFCPEKIEEYHLTIKELLDQLPEPFTFKDGWSFLEACHDKNGNLWGQHKNMQELMLLGLAAGYVEYTMDREFWCILPGGVPYFIIKSERKNIEKQPFFFGDKIGGKSGNNY